MEKHAAGLWISWPDDEILYCIQEQRGGTDIRPFVVRERFSGQFERMGRFVAFLLFLVNEPVA